MKTIQVFESKMREANFASLDEARSGIRTHPLVADYLVDLLVERGVLRVMDSGGVVGCPRSTAVVSSGRRDPKDAVSAEWKSNWPKRDRLISWLACEDGEFVPLRELQKNLKEDGELNGHWVTLHAIWNLTKAGLVEKSSKGYRLSPAGDAERLALVQRGRAAVTEALKSAGAPFHRDAVVSALRATSNHDMLDDGEDWITQVVVDGWVASRIKSGQIPAR